MNRAWVPKKLLRPLDIQKAINTQNSATNLLLSQAYEEAIEHYGINDLTYWEERLLAGKMENGNVSSATTSPTLREKSIYKRKFDTPPAVRNHWKDDQSDEEDFGPNLSHKKIKVEDADLSSLSQVAPHKKSQRVQSKFPAHLASLSLAAMGQDIELVPTESVTCPWAQN